MPCAIIGDSIAAGLHRQGMPGCEVEARGGLTSTAYIEAFSTRWNNDFTVISLGANDRNDSTAEEIRILRNRVESKCVVWLLPNNRPKQREAIKTVASEFGDRLVDTTPFVGPDKLHPQNDGYKGIANEVRATCGLAK